LILIGLSAWYAAPHKR